MAITVSAATVSEFTAQRDSALAAVSAEQEAIDQATARRDAAQARADDLTKVIAGLEASA